MLSKLGWLPPYSTEKREEKDLNFMDFIKYDKFYLMGGNLLVCAYRENSSHSRADESIEENIQF